MSITPLSCPAVSADLLAYHPRIFEAISPSQRDYSAQLSLAFNEMLSDLLGAGYEADRLPNSASNIAATKPVVCHKALAIIFLDLMKERDDKWHVLSQSHEKQYSTSLTSLRLEYDADDDGTISDEEKSFVTSLHLTR